MERGFTAPRVDSRIWHCESRFSHLSLNPIETSWLRHSVYVRYDLQCQTRGPRVMGNQPDVPREQMWLKKEPKTDKDEKSEHVDQFKSDTISHHGIFSALLAGPLGWSAPPTWLWRDRHQNRWCSVCERPVQTLSQIRAAVSEEMHPRQTDRQTGGRTSSKLNIPRYCGGDKKDRLWYW